MAPGIKGVYGVGQGGGDGVFGYSEEGTGIHGSTGPSGVYAGYFDGDVFTSGSYLPSDLNLKKDVADFSSAMAIISKLQPKSYEYRQDGTYKLMHLPQGLHYGLIAQEVEQVLPDLVKATTFENRRAKGPQRLTTGITPATQPSEQIAFKALNYTELIPIIVKGMQEQDRRIQEQEEENKALKSEVAELRRMVLELKGS